VHVVVGQVSNLVQNHSHFVFLFCFSMDILYHKEKGQSTEIFYRE